MKKKILIFMVVLTLIIICVIMVKVFDKNNNKENNEIQENNYITVDKNQISYKEDVTIDELKKDYGLNANSNIYEIQTEYDGRKVLSVKADLKFKVAFCSMIKKEIPKFEELDEIMYNNYLQEKGIWIENDSRDKIINLLNNNEKLNSEYKVNSEGYLIIDKKNNQSELDKTVEKSINSDAQTILVVSSLCYIVDDVTGDILDYNFEKMDKYQTYEYFNDDDKKIVFITENKNNQISSEELLEDIINIL